MRAFFCLPIDEDVRRSIRRAADRLRSETRMAASWVEPENYHVTLRFLGEIEPILTLDLQTVAERVAASAAPFTLDFPAIGAFPTLDRARVLWAGGETPSAFQNLATSLDEGLATLGFEPERKAAVSHVTIARLKGAPDPRLPELARRIGEVFPRSVRPSSVVLMQSELRPQGARYSPLFTVPLPHGRA